MTPRIAPQRQPNSYDDEELTALLIEAQSGNQWKLATFIRHTQSSVNRLVSYLGASGEAEDLTQEVYIRAIRALPNYKATSPARFWLIGIARNVAIDSVRSRQRRHRLSELLRSNHATTNGEIESNHDIAHLLDRLDNDRRTAFVLTQLLGYSYEEAASVCDCAIGTIRSRVARARTELAAAFDH